MPGTVARLHRVAQAFALLAALDAGTVRPRKVFEVEAGRYASAGADFTALLAEGLAELDERGFGSAQVSGQAQIEPRMLAKVRLGHVPRYAAGRRLLRYVEMVRAGDLAPEPVRERPERKPFVMPGNGPLVYAGIGGGHGWGSY